jgi:hypothetical protein
VHKTINQTQINIFFNFHFQRECQSILNETVHKESNYSKETKNEKEKHEADLMSETEKYVWYANV